jgi:GNAT superfamily N-acetyltransferase
MNPLYTVTNIIPKHIMTLPVAESRPKMSLKLQEIRLEDFDTMANHATIYPIGDDLVGMPTPLCWSVSSRISAQERLHFHMAKQRERFLGDRSTTYLKIVDEKTEEIVSIARWHYYPNGYAYTGGIEWEIYSPVEGQPFPQEMNIELYNFILSARDAGRGNWMIKDHPCWIMMHLVTRSSQRGRGAAGMLIKWGVKKAKEDGVAAYLEAGVMGKPIYEKHGFKELAEPLCLDLRPYGVDMDIAMANMGILPQK